MEEINKLQLHEFFFKQYIVEFKSNKPFSFSFSTHEEKKKNKEKLIDVLPLAHVTTQLWR